MKNELLSLVIGIIFSILIIAIYKLVKFLIIASSLVKNAIFLNGGFSMLGTIIDDMIDTYKPEIRKDKPSNNKVFLMYREYFSKKNEIEL